MRFLVSKSILAAIVITAGSLTTHTAQAETTLKVPFNFTVAGQSMPAGVYSVSEDSIHNLVVLKSMGASQSYILRVILRETLLLATAGILLGIAISYLAKVLLTHHFHVLPLLLTGEWVLRAAAIALVGAMLGAIYPAIKAARKDPIDALAYE